MLTRRDVAVGAATLASGMCRSEALAASWSPVLNNARLALNGVVYEAQCGKNGSALQRSPSDVFRFSMIRDNLWYKDNPTDSERTELAGWKSPIDISQPAWMSWSMYYEPGPWSTSDWCILRQVYAMYPKAAAPWSVLLLKPGGELRWVGSAATDKARGLPMVKHTEVIEQGVWLHFVECYKFDPDRGNGYWRSWLNGKLVVDIQGAIGSRGVQSNYAKFGVYRSRQQTSGQPVTETVNMRFANLRFTTNDLADLVKTPEPIPSWEPWP